MGILPSCTAASAAAEACNGLDDNCNGVTDDRAEPTCSDGDACTKDFGAGGSCVHPSVNDCGDGLCADECAETSANCPVDCHICPDGVCQPGESPKTCASDCCGSCGDGKCVGYECGEDKVGGPKHCPADCGTACGNQLCDKGESPSTCAADCAKQVGGNHVCEPGDGGPMKCPQDCAPSCGNCTCEKGESPGECPLDCGFCGDEICSLCAGLSESPAKCAVDCPVLPACKFWPGLCDDGSACTADVCMDGKGCVHPAVQGGACDDGNGCTQGDSCGNDGVCKGKGLDCNDGNLCTADSCDASGCLYAPVGGQYPWTATTAACDDNNVCTTGDVCGKGNCVGTKISCADNNPCTIDGVCIQGSGCSFANYVSLDTACPGGWCNGTGKCGTCTAAHPCAPQPPGTVACSSTNSCVCTPVSKATACGNKNCSTVSIGCGKTISCGTCLSGKVCSGGYCSPPCGQCNVKMQTTRNDKGLECCDNVCQ